MTASTEYRDALPTDSNLNGFRLRQVLGRGGFGITYLASDLLGQDFAIKEYFPRQFAMRQGLSVIAASTTDEVIFADCRQRFLNEASALLRLARVRHDSRIVRVVTCFEANNTAYSVMEFVAGETLEARIRQHPQGLPYAELNGFLAELLPALAAVHDAKLLHRDLKPSNIILRQTGQPVIVDFGSARELIQASDISYTQIYSGAYAPLEQMIGSTQGPYSDIYAVGMTTYRAIGGTPVDALSRERTLSNDGVDPLVPATSLGQGRYPPALLKMIDSALRVRPSDRPQSVPALVRLLESDTADPAPLAAASPSAPTSRGATAELDDTVQATGQPPGSRPAAAPSTPVTWRRKVFHFAGLAAAMLLAIGILGDLTWRVTGVSEADRQTERTATAASSEGDAATIQRDTDSVATSGRPTMATSGSPAGTSARDSPATSSSSAPVPPPPSAEPAMDVQADVSPAPSPMPGPISPPEPRTPPAPDAVALAEPPAPVAIVPPASGSSAAEQSSEPAAVTDQIGPDQITEAQRRLTALGLDTGGVDGKAGARTRSAVLAFDRATGQRSTGEISAAFLTRLRGAVPPPKKTADALFGMALDANRAGQQAEAIRLYEMGLRLSAEPEPFIALGDLHRDRANLTAARKAYQEAAQMGGATARLASARLDALPDALPKLATPGRATGPAVAVATNPKGDWVPKVAATWDLAKQQAVDECEEKYGICTIEPVQLPATGPGCLAVASSGRRTVVAVGNSYDAAMSKAILDCSRAQSSRDRGQCTAAYSWCR